MTSARRIFSLVLVVVVAAFVAGAIHFSRGDERERAGDTASVDDPDPRRPVGGSVRVAVSTPPELTDASAGGRALRQLVLPSLFVAQPDGTWRASLAEPGSDRSADDMRSARLRLRTDARWTDGSPISVDDLRRTRDERFVSSIDGPDASGMVTIRFTQPLPGWRRLWSGDQAISAPRQEVYGGAFRVSSVNSGLETVVVRNDDWFGSDVQPFLDEIRLVLVPDTATARELMSSGQIDVIAPGADTVRTDQLRSIPGVEVSRQDDSGQWTVLRLNPSRLSDDVRRAIIESFPRSDFVRGLLDGEADLMSSLSGSETLWEEKPKSTPPLSSLTDTTITLVSSSQEPLGSLLGRTFERAITSAGGTVRLQVDDEAKVASWIKSGTYDVVLETGNDGPSLCWTCHFDHDHALAMQADSGDERAATALQTALRDQMLVLPLWRAHAVVGFRHDVVDGIEANGYAASVTWNAQRWWKP